MKWYEVYFILIWKIFASRLLYSYFQRGKAFQFYMQPIGNLKKSIRHTGLSQQYIDQSIRMGIECLNDFMTADIPSLKAHPEFSMLWYTEILKILDQEDLLKEFQKRL